MPGTSFLQLARRLGAFRWRVVGAISVCFIARGMFYAAATPLWEGFDEHAEMAILQSVDDGNLLPPAMPHLSREIETSMRAVPLPRALTGTGKGYVSHDEFWRLPEASRRTRERALRAIPALERREVARGAAVNAMWRGPLYSWLLRPVWLALHPVLLLDRVFLLRMLNVLLAALAIPLAFLLARAVFEDEASALCATAAFGAIPQVMINVSHAGGEALALVLATALALAAVRVRNTGQSAALGVLVGLAMLVELYFAALLVACALVLFRRWRAALVSTSVAAAISGWWYVRAWMMSPRVRTPGLREVLGKLDWLRAADFTWNTLVWAGNGSFLGLRSWVYRIMLVVFLVALFGLSRAGRHWNQPVWTLVALHVALALALVCAGISDVRAGGIAATPGWYLCSLAAGGACLLVYGFRSLTPGAATIPVFAFAALDLYGLHIVLMPYYAGLIAYSSTGRLGAFPVGRWSYEVFDRLAVNKPYWLSSPVLAGLWAGYVISTAGLIGITAWVRTAGRVDVCRSTE